MSESDELDELRQRKRDELLNQQIQSSNQQQSTGTPTEPVYVRDPNHFQELTGDGLVLVDFYADWCGPCQMMEPTLEELASEQQITVAKVDIDQHQQLAQQHGVRSVPTLVLYKNGEVVEQLLGVQDYGTLANLISQFE